MKINMKWGWGIGLGVIIVIGLITTMNMINATDSATAQTTETVEAFIGDLGATATATGQLEAQMKANLSLPQSGEVNQLFVEVGDEVNAGDILLTLDPTTLERTVQDAEQALLIQQSRLTDMVQPATEVELAAAEASVANAQARLDDLLQGGSDAEIAAQEAAVQAARADVAAASARSSAAQSGGTSDELLAAQHALEDAQVAYTEAEEAHRTTYDCTWNDATAAFDCVGGSDAEKAARVTAQQALANLRAAEERLADLQPGGAALSVASAQASVSSAQASLTAEQARLDQLRNGASTADIAAAEATLANAKQQLDNLVTGPSDTDITQQEVMVEQARLALERAQNNLADATLVAPFDGIVTAVNVNLGETANGVVIELVNMNSMEVVLEVDEIDLGSLNPGQDASVAFETYPGREVAGQVVAIAPENTPNTSGTVVYEVNLALNETDLFLLEGMTADANLITDQREGVLLVANSAIKSDRSSGTFSVDVVTGRNDDGALLVENTPVTIGLRDSSFTQITGGIEEGTVLAVGYTPPPSQEFGPPGFN